MTTIRAVVILWTLYRRQIRVDVLVQFKNVGLVPHNPTIVPDEKMTASLS
jgi:hypothetical protein